MRINEAFIVDFLRYKAGRPLKIKEMAKEIGIPGSEYSSFRNKVKELIDAGKLVRLRHGKVGVPSELNLILGNVTVSKSGYGTITTESGEPVVITPNKMFTAFDGDRVMVRVGTGPDDELHGTIIKVIRRAEKNIVGIFRHGPHFSTVVPDDKKFRRDVYIPNRLTKKATDGQRVIARITHWDDPYRNPEGEITEVIGRPGDPGVDLKTVIKSHGLPERFPKKVNDDAAKASEYLTPAEIKSRRDFTKEIICTIDPADAKDFDDAISVVKTQKGYRLGVYIADVSFFVREGSEVDKEAFNRGNSVYLPGKVIPMLPEKLSNDLCSLKPNRRRLVFAVVMDISPKGKPLDWRIVKGVINSRARLTYEEVQKFFDTGVQSSRIKRVAGCLTTARELAKILQKNRMAEGSLDFDLPEAKIVLNKRGEIVEIGNRIRLESHRLIEEFMLMANKVVALHVFRLGQKLLYRVHDRPDLEKLEAFSTLMTSLGYSFPVSGNMKPLQFARFLQKVKGKPEEEFVNELMLRSMKKAVYQPQNIGHFGLAFKHYTHFTSPIRRYPDLLVHRLLKMLDKKRYPDKIAKRLDSILTNVGKHCSETERIAETAEREAVRIKQVAYMASRIGQQYHGVISGLLNFGFFVRINDIGIEGMVRLSSLDDDYYKFDEKRFRLTGRRTGRIFKMGDPVDIGILAVDTIKNQIDLYLVEPKSKSDKKRPVKRKRKRR
jgi:ribonuclease R